jgi:fatty acid desaturase
MSRAERRAYQRMNKNRDPYAMPVAPAQKARIERVRARREQKRSADVGFVTPRLLVWAAGGAVVAGLVAFSIAWPNGMPQALYVGLAAAAVWAVLVIGVRLLLRRAAANRP